MNKSIIGVISILILVAFVSGCISSDNLNNKTNNSTNITNSSNNNSSEDLVKQNNSKQNNKVSSKEKSSGVKCSFCDGKGYYVFNKICKTCDGTGSINGEICSNCEGTGSNLYKEKVRCEGCRGDGIITKGDPGYNF